jgi:beta-lactamase class A
MGVMTSGIEAIFEQVNCVGTLCVQRLDGTAEVALRADQLMTPASVVKVQIALGAVMSHQLTRHRIASGFLRPVTIAAKTGSLLDLVRNEVGVISYPDGQRYAAAVFTRSQPGADDAAINRAIGTAAARAVAVLRGQ